VTCAPILPDREGPGRTPPAEWAAVRVRLPCGQQALGDLLGAAQAGFAAFHLCDPVGDFLACGVVQPVEPAAERAVLAQGALQFGGYGDDACFGVGLQAKLRDGTGNGFAAGLHPFVYEHDVIALAGGKE